MMSLGAVAHATAPYFCSHEQNNVMLIIAKINGRTTVSLESIRFQKICNAHTFLRFFTYRLAFRITKAFSPENDMHLFAPF